MAKQSANRKSTESPADEAVKPKASPKKAAKKATVKKAATTPAPVLTTAPATKKPAARKTAAKKSARPASPKTSVAIEEPVASPISVVSTEEPLESGVILPRAKRPAAKRPVNGSVLYRQQRDATIAREAREVEEVVPELPEIYGLTHMAALIRDSEWIFVYWEFTTETRAEFDLDNREVSRGLALRLYDITGVAAFDGANALSHVDIPINTLATSWYIHVPESGRAYVVEVGLLGPDGFRAIARSNEVEMPRHSIAETSGWEWSHSEEEAHRQMLRLSGGPSVPLNLSSAEFLEAWNSRVFDEGAGFSGTMFSGSLPLGSSEQSSLLVSQRASKGRDRGFWLKVDAEVIVYGATDPKAKVRFMGREVQLSPDGTFGIRMALPDGTIEFPVIATSPDDQETREVCPVISRRTS